MALGTDIIPATPVYDYYRAHTRCTHLLIYQLKSCYEALTHIPCHPMLSKAYSSGPNYVKLVTPMNIYPTSMIPPSPGLLRKSFYETLTPIASPASLSKAYPTGAMYDTHLTVGLPRSKLDQMPIYVTPSFGSSVHYNSSY